MLLTRAEGLVLLAFLLLVAVLIARPRERRKLPPGPKGVPFLGSAHRLPAQFQEQKLFEWAKQYGDIVYFKIFRTPTIVLNTIEAARDLLEKRSTKYSDRPRMVLLGEMVGQDVSLPVLGYGEQLRRQRRWLYEGVGSKEKLKSFQELQRREARNMSRNLLKNPTSFFDHIHLYLASILLEVTYGFRVNSLDDELVQVGERGINAANTLGTPGSTLVDFFPILKHIPTWLPGASFKRKAIVVRECVEELKNRPYNMVFSAIASGTAAPSVLATLLAEYGGAPTLHQAEEIKGLTFGIYGAGVETSRGTILQFLLNMTRNPRVLRKAQEEMDRVIGGARLPDFPDRERLPYLNAVLEEVYRWYPSLPLAVPHGVLTADKYRDYDIPAGTMVIPNTWAMARDTRYYPEPEQFRPERYLRPPDGQEDRLLPSSFVFGFGRRVCPGQAFADASIWLAMAHMVALFDVMPTTDDSGNEIVPPATFISGFTTQPTPFACKITLRPDAAAALLAQASD